MNPHLHWFLLEGGVLLVKLPPVWNLVGAVGVFKGDEGAADVLEEERYKRPSLPGRFFLLEEGRACMLAFEPMGVVGLLFSRAHH